ncbi:formyltransferase family protein [Magnetovibrio sp. PR-2]|uniref:methionyl-tRNA formyltransferase n=1 Tax=Magnetovibrio sp. PR-2 TaxID=3120356 RepID=UPI002FCE4BF5
MTTDTYRPFEPGSFSRLIIIGFGSPTVVAAKFAVECGLDVFVGASERQLDIVDANGDKVMASLQALGIVPELENKLSDFSFYQDEGGRAGDAVLSVGSPFIFRQNFLDLFPQRVFNSHGAPLPKWRGGGGYSWRILADERRGNACIHLVTTGIDGGDIVFQEGYTFANDLTCPREYEVEAAKHEAVAIEQFLSILRDGGELNLIRQDESQSTYFPRLHTPTQAWINWSWQGKMVERFVRAFSHPYPGARTLVNDGEVLIYHARFEASVDIDHPFFNGLIVRVDESDMMVVCEGGHLMISLNAIETDQTLQVGDRLYTPQAKLDTALSFRPVYTPTGLKVKS